MCRWAVFPRCAGRRANAGKLLNLGVTRRLKMSAQPACPALRRVLKTGEIAMTNDANTNGNYAQNQTSLRLKTGLAEMLKGGVIMDVMDVEQAKIAEQAGAVAVMALERVPAMIRAEGGVARMAKPSLIKEIINAVSIPIMAKARIGHFAEAQILQHLGVDFIDER